MRSANQNHFAQAPSAEISRSVFNRNHSHKTTFDSGYLVPFFHDEVLPGDTFHLKATLFARLMTPIYPVMDNMYLDTFFFFVPNRLVWDNWQHFMGEKDDPDDDIDWLVPIVTGPTTIPGIPVGSLYDYFGLPVSQTNCNPTALWFRAYNKIINDWFLAQDFQEKLPVNNDSDGPDSFADYNLVRRNKRHDYFTSCLPRPQKGDAVEIPLGTTAPVIGDGNAIQFFDSTYKYYPYSTNGSNSLQIHRSTSTYTLGADIGTPTPGAQDYKAIGLRTNSLASTGMIADLAHATAATINSLREAFQLQKMLERDQRGGTRYWEVIWNHFKVKDISHAILQRSEYLGGSSQRINVTVVPNTALTGSNALGQLGGHAQVADQCGFHKSFTEHGMVIALLSVRADMTYQYGLHKMFTRRSRYDYYWPSFAHLGEQEVLNQEIYFDGTDLTGNAEVFGYQERYAEYRYYPSKITGYFRSIVASGLDSWHLAQQYSGCPTLDSTFLEENPPIDRIVVSGEEGLQFKLDSFMEYTCARAMPVFSIPGLIDHF